MKIIDNTKVTQSFIELHVGTVFKFTDTIYMKTQSVSNEFSDYNAVSLDKGKMEYFSDLEQVNVISAFLTIE